MESSLTAAPDTSPPLPDSRAVHRLGLIGLSITATAAFLGLVIDLGSSDGGADWAARVRNALTPVGILVAGCAVSMRPQLATAWLIAGGACLLGGFGFAPSWDSARLVCWVFGAIALFGALMLRLPPAGRYIAGSVLILFHFSGIMSAVTSPPPTPYISLQAWTRVFRPYLQFAYMNNAYQFYSPDPGPASEVWACIEFGPPGEAKEGERKVQPVHRWMKVPKRPQHWRDPLGQTYYRRLALTEQIVSYGQTYTISAREMNEIGARRQKVTDIPTNPEVPALQQFHPPSDNVRRILLPSYVRFIARDYADAVEGMEVKKMKIYLVKHIIISPENLRPAVRLNPYDPTTYQPSYLGEFDRDGNLVNPLDPLLYWHIPILRKPGAGFVKDRMEELSDEDYDRHFDDNVIKHAGSDHRKELLP